VKLAVAFGITGVGALALKKAGLQLPHSVWPIAAALAVGGVLFLLVERWIRGKEMGEEVTWTVAVVVGLAQMAAVAFPGTSRSGITIIMSLLLGLARVPATEFSFLLGVPTLCAAGLKTAYDAHKTHEVILWSPLIVATLVAAISSFAAVRWLLGYVRTHTFAGFGWYRIAFALIIVLLVRVGLD
jgi:undecaprenyl-diphosphatase